MSPFIEELDPPPDPVRCCEQLEGLPYRLFLDSAVPGGPLARYSFVTADPVAVVRSKRSRTEYLDLLNGLVRVVDGDALDTVRALLLSQSAEPVPGLPPFQGGAAGYLAYDWGRVLERLPESRHDDLAMPDVVLGIYDWVLAWDHEMSRTWLISTGLPETSLAARDERAARRAGVVRARLGLGPAKAGHYVRAEAGPDARAGTRLAKAGQDVRAEAGQTKAHEALTEPVASSLGPMALVPRASPAPSYPVEDGWWDPRLSLRSSFSHAGYIQAVTRVRDYIMAGDIFQANLAQRFEAPLDESPWTLYRRLRMRNAAPFATYFEFPDAVVLGASPERFLRVDVEGHVETRPIKGTRPRGLGPEHDAALGQALTESAKDRAENLMIVDLLRNDLSRVCAPGTVRVPELFALERYATVHHLVSTVVGDLAPGTDVSGLLRAAFPGGSITGAPKVRAMEIIAELETSERGVYCGAMIYWSVTGALDSSIAIRTAIARPGRVYFSAGGGIVADSDPEQEYRETLDKARGMIDALATPS